MVRPKTPTNSSSTTTKKPSGTSVINLTNFLPPIAAAASMANWDSNTIFPQLHQPPANTNLLTLMQHQVAASMRNQMQQPTLTLANGGGHRNGGHTGSHTYRTITKRNHNPPPFTIDPYHQQLQILMPFPQPQSQKHSRPILASSSSYSSQNQNYTSFQPSTHLDSGYYGNQLPNPYFGRTASRLDHSRPMSSSAVASLATPIAYHHGTTNTNVLKFAPSPVHTPPPPGSNGHNYYLANFNPGTAHYWTGPSAMPNFSANNSIPTDNWNYPPPDPEPYEDDYLADGLPSNKLASHIAGRMLNPNASDFVPTSGRRGSGSGSLFSVTPSSSKTPSPDLNNNKNINSMAPPPPFEVPRRSTSFIGRASGRDLSLDQTTIFDSLTLDTSDDQSYAGGGGGFKWLKKQKASTPKKSLDIGELLKDEEEVDEPEVDISQVKEEPETTEASSTTENSFDAFCSFMKFDELLAFDTDDEVVDDEVPASPEKTDADEPVDVHECSANSLEVHFPDSPVVVTKPQKRSQPIFYRKASIDLHAIFHQRSSSPPKRHTRAASFSCDPSEYGPWASYPDVSSSSSHHAFSQSKFKAQLYKTEMCRNITEFATCPFAAECRFAHSEEERRHFTRAVHVKYKTAPCTEYESGNVCYYGTRCWFIHEKPAVEDSVTTFENPIDDQQLRSSSSSNSNTMDQFFTPEEMYKFDEQLDDWLQYHGLPVPWSAGGSGSKVHFENKA